MLEQTLRALKTSVRMPDEIWVVDDASTDKTADVARESGACVLSMARNVGPSACRNHAAVRVKSSILVFLDADKWVHPDTIQRLEEYLLADPDLGAVIGAYDDSQRRRYRFSGPRYSMGRFAAGKTAHAQRFEHQPEKSLQHGYRGSRPAMPTGKSSFAIFPDRCVGC
jgi:glycosyltransferase involved in cell wall biosynthesis